MSGGEWLAQRLEEQRGRLQAMAYRMPGSLAEADGAVQESWLRLSRSGTAGIENLAGWLTTATGRVCLDMLQGTAPGPGTEMGRQRQPRGPAAATRRAAGLSGGGIAPPPRSRDAPAPPQPIGPVRAHLACPRCSLSGMAVPDARRPARGAVDDFIRDLASRQFSSTTRRIRRHFLSEYLQHAQEAAGTVPLRAGELMDPGRADAWLTDAAAGKLRTRNTFYGPGAAAYRNSMRVRADSYNAFAEYLGLPGRRDSPPPARGFSLAPADTERVLHDLTVRRPIHANAATSLRTAALAALVADTGRGVPELARLDVSALRLDGAGTADLTGASCPLSAATVQILTRWLSARAAIIAELDGSDPGYLWIPTKPGRPRGGRPPVKPGLSRAAVRTLHAAHRTLVSQLLGTPLRPGALRDHGAVR